MSTGGLYGFIKNGVEKASFIRMGAEPSSLGRTVVDFVKDMTDNDLYDMFRNVVTVKSNDMPSAEELVYMLSSGQFDGTWNEIIRGCQGDFALYKELAERNKKIYMTDDGELILDSILCSYAYYINLDTMHLEYWKGLQPKPCRGNRYGTEKHGPIGFFPCRMLKRYPLDAVRERPAAEIINEMERSAKADEKKMSKNNWHGLLKPTHI